MDQHRLDRIRKIASDVRGWAEKNKHLADAPTDLTGMCAISSVELSKRLKHEKIYNEIAYTDYHVFVVVEGHIVDVTASQFDKDNEDVVIATLDDVKEQHHWQPKQLFSNRQKFREHLVSQQWPKEQIPRTHMLFTSRHV